MSFSMVSTPMRGQCEKARQGYAVVLISLVPRMVDLGTVFPGMGAMREGEQVGALLGDGGVHALAQHPRGAVLDGQDARRVVYITLCTVVLEGLDITRGRSTFDGGGAAIAYATVTFNDCVFSANTAPSGFIGGGATFDVKYVLAGK